MECFSCHGPYHEATGDWDPKFEIARCGPCMKRFIHWLKGHLNRKWSKHVFYEHAATSIRADKEST